MTARPSGSAPKDAVIAEAEARHTKRGFVQGVKPPEAGHWSSTDMIAVRDDLAEQIVSLRGELAEAKKAGERAASYWQGEYGTQSRRANVAEVALAASEAQVRELRSALREFTPEGTSHNGVAIALREYASKLQQLEGKWTARMQTLVDWAIAIEAALSASAPTEALNAALRARDAIWCSALTGQSTEVIEAVTRAFNELRPDKEPDNG